MMETLEIGGTPYEQDCAATGVTDDAGTWNRLECRAYIAALKKVYGDPQQLGLFKVQSNQHEFGTYYEVVFKYDTSSPEACAYARKVENGLATWRLAGFHTPVIYDRNSQPLTAIVDPELWDMQAFMAATPERQRAGVKTF